MLFFSQKRNKQICGNIFSNGNVKVCQTCSRYWHYLVWYKLSFKSRFMWIESVYKCLCFFCFFCLFVFLFLLFSVTFLCFFVCFVHGLVKKLLGSYLERTKLLTNWPSTPYYFNFISFAFVKVTYSPLPPKTMFYSDSPNFQLYTGNNDWGGGGILSMI